jgi:hypothetical protein
VDATKTSISAQRRQTFFVTPYHAVTASETSVERVRNAYERMNDSPTQPSILMRDFVRV